jgi:hypothetical protein
LIDLKERCTFESADREEDAEWNEVEKERRGERRGERVRV